VSCDSHRVSAGRGSHTAAAAGIAALAIAFLVPPAANATTPVTPLSKGKHKTRFVFLKTRVAADGIVTPGHAETISISRMAPKANIAVFIEPPPTTLQCGELYFCDVAPAGPAPGSAPFVADKKGRAVISFVMPDTYYLETDPFNPKIRQPVSFADQQRIHIDVQGSSKIRHVQREAFGFARAIVHRSSS
jgi:hypothetical protein